MYATGKSKEIAIFKLPSLFDILEDLASPQASKIYPNVGSWNLKISARETVQPINVMYGLLQGIFNFQTFGVMVKHADSAEIGVSRTVIKKLHCRSLGIRGNLCFII